MNAALGLGRCDGQGCAVPMQDGMLALSRRPESLGEDCARAAILVSRAETGCKGPKLVIDGARAAREQGYAIWLAPLRIESVRGWRGERPWVR